MNLLQNAAHARGRRSEVISGKSVSCAIVYCRSPGMASDAAVIDSAVKAAYPNAKVVTFGLHSQFMRDYTTPVELKEELRARTPFDFVFLLEHAHANPPFLDPGFARRVVYVPNVEWIAPADEQVIASGAIDTVLLKSRYAGAVKDGQLYTGWTSFDVGRPVAGERSWARCLHVCGKSPQKNADAVVAAWLRNPDFPPATIVATTQAGMDLSMPLAAADNLTLLLQLLPEPKLRALQRASGIHVFPSFAEGFGHALNEARASAALLVTTGGPPMDELVEDGVSGILVPMRPENCAPYHRVTAFRVTSEDLAESIRRALKMSEGERMEMGLRARAQFEHDRSQFYQRIRILFD
jgi:glycosyltransferase involved in cell wall biosynthesis